MTTTKPIKRTVALLTTLSAHGATLTRIGQVGANPARLTQLGDELDIGTADLPPALADKHRALVDALREWDVPAVRRLSLDYGAAIEAALNA